MPGDIHAFKAGQCSHPDVVELREEEGVDKMAAVDGKLRVVERFLSDLESRWSRPQKAAISSPVQLRLQLLGPTNQVGQIHPEQIVAFDHIRIAFFNQAR